MRYGTRDEFDYFECATCGCIQIAAVPENLSEFYPLDYWVGGTSPRRRISGIKRWAARSLSRYYLTGRGVMGRALAQKYPAAVFLEWASRAEVGLDSSILDIGCGGGDLLLNMWNNGFTQLAGVDPFIDKDVHYPGGPHLLKRDIFSLDGRYDLIMMHHSFEHVSDPSRTLSHVATLLNPQGCLLIRTPLAESYAWRAYGVDWVQLDPPRHLFVHTIRSVQEVAGQSGLVVREVCFDSDELQFVGSELYRRDIPLIRTGDYFAGGGDRVFSCSDIEAMRAKAHELNVAGDGDQGCLYLTKRQD
jgi:hypothetical protein